MQAPWQEQVIRIMASLPVEATLATLIQELSDWEAVERALADRNAGRLSPHSKMSWLILTGMGK